MAAENKNIEIDILKLADGEYRFADLVWENEPINSTKLVKISEKSWVGKKQPLIQCCASCVSEAFCKMKMPQ